jgi:hypothetical protein
MLGSYQAPIIQSLKVSVAYCIFCYALQEIFLLIMRLVPATMASKGIKFQVANRGVSTVHAVVMFAFTANYWMTINNHMKLLRGSGYEDFCIDLMLGYLYYDVVQELRATAQWDTVGHHLMGALSHWPTRVMHCDAAYFYTMLVYLAEASTPFLHICWVMHTFKLNSNPAFLPLCGMLLLTFFVFRILQGSFIVWHLYENGNQGWEGHEFMRYLNTFILLFFVGLNSFWFVKLVQMATGLGKTKKVKE